jgi:prefoldin subunit 5
MSKEQELDFLRSQAEAIKEELEQIDARIKELEKQ